MDSIAKTYNGNILAALSEMEGKLPSALKKLAKFILENPEESLKATLSELAKVANVGEATVVRLVKLLNFDGYKEFKIELAIELSKKSEKKEIRIMDPNIEEHDLPLMVAKKIESNVSGVLAENIEFLNEQTLSSVVNAIVKAERILIFGMGNSGLSATYLKNKLSRIGLNAASDFNAHYMYTTAALLKPGDVALGISQYGAGYETNKAMQISKNAGATCICITHHPSSELAKLSDYILYSANQENLLQGDSVATIVSQLHVCEIIYTMILQQNLQKALKIKQLTVKSLDLNIDDK